MCWFQGQRKRDYGQGGRRDNFTERRIPQDRGSKEKDCARLARKGQLHGMENTTARMSGKKGKMERNSSRSVAKEKLKDGLCYIMDV